jgi:hypothetical protein
MIISVNIKLIPTTLFLIFPTAKNENCKAIEFSLFITNEIIKIFKHLKIEIAVKNTILIFNKFQKNTAYTNSTTAGQNSKAGLNTLVFFIPASGGLKSGFLEIYPSSQRSFQTFDLICKFLILNRN